MPQVGVGLGLFITCMPKQRPLVYINPRFTKLGKKTTTASEGCLSYPGLKVPVARSKRVKMAYTDIAGNHRIGVAHGFEARVWQHEMDHLFGINLPHHMKQY